MAQFLTVMNGGKLIQHVENHKTSHQIRVPNYGSFVSTSTHHQMMFPYNLHESEYKIIGYSKYFMSDKYFGSQNVNIELPSNFLELEIVYYPKYKSLCIQGHPEHNNATSDFKNLCLNLIYNYLIKQ